MPIYLPICIAAHTPVRNECGSPLLYRHMLIREFCVAAGAKPEIAALTSLIVTTNSKPGSAVRHSSSFILSVTSDTSDHCLVMFGGQAVVAFG